MGTSARWRKALLATALGAAAFVLIRQAARLPERRELKAAPLPDVFDTHLARGTRSQMDDRDGRSGIRLLSDGLDAFAARLLLVRAAERRLDLQYYIWHGDLTGTLLLEEVHAAANRGVRVRLLLDDNGISGLDTVLAALDQHPNVEVRLFNPFRIRFPKALGFLMDFGRLNRRMHNKSLTADAAATIVGGRNVGDEYFGAGDGALFADLDVLAIGPVVDAVEADFERYWNCASVYPADQILPPVGDRRLRELSKRASLIERDPSAQRYVERLRILPLIRQVAEGSLDLEWARVRVISDDPAKGLGAVPDKALMISHLSTAMGPVEQELKIVSGYFVPGSEGTRHLAALAASGVAVTVLTNGYAASDVGLVHAGYAPHRRKLLESGVRLYEIKPRDDGTGERRGRRSRLGIGSTLGGTGKGSTAALRSGASTLHAKTFAIDRKRLFIGSFNFDPRSIHLNTELGFVIESPKLAAEVAVAIEDEAPMNAHAVHFGPGGRLTWKGHSGDVVVTFQSEPGMTRFDHAIIAVISRLPVAWML